MKTQIAFQKVSMQVLLVSAFLTVAAGQPQFPSGPPGQLPPPRPPGNNCAQMIPDAVQGEPPQSAYANHMLFHVHDALHRFNKIETADLQMIFCQLTSVMGFNPDLTQLPQTLTKTTREGDTVVLNVVAPTEAFATSAGYAAKATLTFNGTQFLAMWWAGSGTNSKGYLIEGQNPLQRDGMTRIKYLLWDRTVDAQVLKVFGAQYASTQGFLQSPNGAPQSASGGDHVIFGRINYNVATGTIFAQSVDINKPPGAPSLGCIKAEFGGVLTGSIDAYGPASGTPAAVSNTDVTGADASMNGVLGLADSKTTANSAGTPASTPLSLPVALDYSCNQLNTANQTGGVFAGSAVNFGLLPSQVFPN